MAGAGPGSVGESKVGADVEFERKEEVVLPDGRRMMCVKHYYLLDPECPGDRILCAPAEGDVPELLVPPRDAGAAKYMDEFVHEAERALWSSLDVDVSQDKLNLKKIMEGGDSDLVRACELMRKIHAWFAFSEDLIQDCVLESQIERCTLPEERAFLRAQNANEVTHAASYQTVLMGLVPDRTERDAVLKQMSDSAALKAKQDWIRRYTDPSRNTQLQIRVAAACSEAIFFMCSFTIIFAVKPLALFPGICNLNDYISRDESHHAAQHAHNVRELVVPEMTPAQLEAFHEMARDRVRSAVEAEYVFADDLLPTPFPKLGISAPLLKQYVRFVGDCVLGMFGVPPMFKDENPFDFMTLIKMQGRENFHDLGSDVTEYQKSVTATVDHLTEVDL